MKKIKGITKKARQKLANNVAKRWRDIYFNKTDKWYKFNPYKDKTPEQVWFALLSLGKNPDPDKVDLIIGNNSWTSINNNFCSSCGGTIYNGVELYDTVNLCIVCIEEAYKLCK